MSEIIKLPAGTKKIPVYEIPSLLASSKGTKSLLINIEKKLASSEQTLPLSDDDAKQLIEIWRIETDLNVLFRITKEKWLEREAIFNNAENKPEWSLVPIWAEFPNVVEEREIHQQVENSILHGQGDFKLTIRHPTTNAPTKESLPDAFVTVEEFIRYARIVHLVQVQLQSEQDLIKAETLPIIQGKTQAIHGLSKRVIMRTFAGLHFNYDQWGRALSDVPKWLIDCRVSRGSKGKKVSHFWNPVLIGLALMDKGVTKKQLNLAFMNLKDWSIEWQEKTDLMD